MKEEDEALTKAINDPTVEIVIKSDELMVEVYWGAPDRSKQRIIGRRDTLLLPTDINYHRDHLGVVHRAQPGPTWIVVGVVIGMALVVAERTRPRER